MPASHEAHLPAGRPGRSRGDSRHYRRGRRRHADSFLGQLRQRCALLAEQPMIGRERPELYPGLRSFAFGHYVILYRVLTDEVEIAAVIHGTRDIERLF
ncbi:MAG: type II toxin-antitoxin system RelE/ParE family toxin [Rhizobiales bacterium]|nr:type II toxin-antitoxin system RelE/ParE family toxin [Hyphomicrobiales bacterium]